MISKEMIEAANNIFKQVYSEEIDDLPKIEMELIECDVKKYENEDDFFKGITVQDRNRIRKRTQFLINQPEPDFAKASRITIAKSYGVSAEVCEMLRRETLEDIATYEIFSENSYRYVDIDLSYLYSEEELFRGAVKKELDRALNINPSHLFESVTLAINKKLKDTYTPSINYNDKFPIYYTTLVFGLNKVTKELK